MKLILSCFFPSLLISTTTNAFVLSPVKQNLPATKNPFSKMQFIGQSSHFDASSSKFPSLCSTASGKDGKEIDLLDEADSIFDSIDTNNDGVISLEELRNHLVGQMGYTTEYTEYLFSSLDTDSDGEITRDEMRFSFYNFEALAMYMTFGVGGSEVTSRDVFKKFAVSRQSSGSDYYDDKLLTMDLADLIFDMIDADKSEKIDKDELMNHFEEVTAKFSEKGTDSQAYEYVTTMFAALDKNKDGFIEREEMREAFQLYDFKLLANTFGLRVYRNAKV